MKKTDKPLPRFRPKGTRLRPEVEADEAEKEVEAKPTRAQPLIGLPYKAPARHLLSQGETIALYARVYKWLEANPSAMACTTDYGQVSRLNLCDDILRLAAAGVKLAKD